MFTLFRALSERVKALCVTTAALDFEAAFLSRQAERKADLLRQAAQYEAEGLPLVARDLRQHADGISVQRPLASILPAIEHLEADCPNDLLRLPDRTACPAAKAETEPFQPRLLTPPKKRRKS